jgi:hypothetical protein
MTGKIVGLIIQYGNYLVAAGLLLYLAHTERLRRLRGVAVYLSCLIAVDAISRPYVLYRYGLQSKQYVDFYWLTDLVLVLTAFSVVCDFFRRGTSDHKEMWRYIRWILVFAFIAVMGVSTLTLSKNYDQLSWGFIVEFSQNLYFTCLVLITLLYLMLQQMESQDDELAFLVCGMGIAFAGPAASMALLHLAGDAGFARALTSFLIPVCNLAMLIVWFYSVAKVESKITGAAPVKGDAALVPVVVDQGI